MDALNRIKFLEDRLHRLSEIGMALSTEKDTNVLFEMILDEAKNSYGLKKIFQIKKMFRRMLP